MRPSYKLGSKFQEPRDNFSVIFKKLIHALIFYRLDYCNSVFTVLPERSITQLQQIQMAAAWVVIKSRKMDHFTLVLNALPWLPVIQRANFKILLLVNNALNGLRPK